MVPWRMGDSETQSRCFDATHTGKSHALSIRLLSILLRKTNASYFDFYGW